jgi:hypothetical protein
MNRMFELPRLPLGLHTFLIAVGLAASTIAASSWWTYARAIDARVDALAREDVEYQHAWEVFDDTRSSLTAESEASRRWEKAQLRELSYRAEKSRLESQLVVRDAKRAQWLGWLMAIVVLAGMVLALCGQRLWVKRDRLEQDVLRRAGLGGA